MKVLVIPEDPRLDQYMLKPLVEAALAHAGRRRATVRVCQHGELRGDATILNADAIKGVLADYPMFDHFLLCVDRDCRETRPVALQELERIVRAEFPSKKFTAVCGIEELEVWVLAGMTDLPYVWKDVRSACNPKEEFFAPYAEARGVTETPGRGRQVLGKEAASRYAARVRQMCPEIQVIEIEK